MEVTPKKPRESLLRAMKQAQFLAFAPLLFQATQELVKRGILERLIASGPEGLSARNVADAAEISLYGATVLLEAGLAVEAVRKDRDLFFVTKLGYLLARDPMTRANMNFTADVCYAPARHLGASIDEGRAAGLSELGSWPTVYEGLSTLGEPARTSWFAFDHFYSDDTFPLVVPFVLAKRAKRVLDVGGNTGKFARALLAADDSVEITLADLPGQIGSARENLAKDPGSGRVGYHEVDLLSEAASLPRGFDVVWMSQFLCCFSEAEIDKILRLAKTALRPGGTIFIMDNFWDVQESDVQSLCIQATSLYFTCVANGNSRMYDYRTMERLVENVGLSIRKVTHEIGLGHSLIECSV